MLRLLLTLLLFASFQQSGVPRIRLLLRDETGTGVAGATLNLRTESGQAFHLTTDATGVVVSDALPGKAVWLLSGRRSDDRTLIADSYPADVGFRLVLIPGQVRDVLLRLDADRIVLDPDMIFSPGDPGEIALPTPIQLAATVAPLAPAAPPPADTTADAPTVDSAPSSSALWIVLALVGVGVLLIAGALLLGRASRRQA